MARIKSQAIRHRAGHNGVPGAATRVDVIFELSASEAQKLPPSARIKANFPDATVVESQVRKTGGEIAMRFYLSEHPYRGAPGTHIPDLALKAVNKWLEAGAPGVPNRSRRKGR